MGAFGFGPFDNDDALDFLDEIEDAEPADRPELLRAALDQVLGDRGYVDAPKMSEAIAAAAVVSISLNPDLPCAEPDLPEWVRGEVVPLDPSLADVARRVLTRAMVPQDNELWQLWERDHSLAAVRALLEPTVRRLGGIPA